MATKPLAPQFPKSNCAKKSLQNDSFKRLRISKNDIIRALLEIKPLGMGSESHHGIVNYYP